MTKSPISDSSFDPQAIEQSLFADWEAADDFAPQGNGSGYCILIPPPNVTGTLHMGHAFNQTLMDALIRYKRMKGHRTLWQMGTDHAGPFLLVHTKNSPHPNCVYVHYYQGI